MFVTKGRMRSEMEQFQDLDRIRREFDTTQVIYVSIFVTFPFLLLWCVITSASYLLQSFQYSCFVNFPLIIQRLSFLNHIQNKLQELKQGYMKRRDTMRQQVTLLLHFF